MTTTIIIFGTITVLVAIACLIRERRLILPAVQPTDEDSLDRADVTKLYEYARITFPNHNIIAQLNCLYNVYGEAIKGMRNSNCDFSALRHNYIRYRILLAREIARLSVEDAEVEELLTENESSFTVINKTNQTIEGAIS